MLNKTSARSNEKFSLKDAKATHKKQYSKARYEELMDIPKGYSKARMLEILQDRCAYLIKRGSTLNNPHIPEGYFSDETQFVRIKSNHQSTLITLLRKSQSERAKATLLPT